MATRRQERQAKDPLVKIETVSGKDYEVRVSPLGQFYAETDPDPEKSHHISAPTLGDLIEKLRREVRKGAVKVAVPATLGNEKGGTEDVVFYNVHARNSQLLYRDSNGKAAARSSWSHRGEEVFRPLTPEQKDEFRRLTEALDKAEREMTEFREEHVFDNIENVVKAEIEKKLAAPEPAAD